MSDIKQSQTACPVRFTEGARSEINRLIKETDIPSGHGLRVGVKGGGCSGFSYILGFDEKQENDQFFEMEDLTIYMDPAHGLYLAGMEIDYLDGLQNRGFVFNNPNATDTCGCGTSFSA